MFPVGSKVRLLPRFESFTIYEVISGNEAMHVYDRYADTLNMANGRSITWMRVFHGEDAEDTGRFCWTYTDELMYADEWVQS